MQYIITTTMLAAIAASARAQAPAVTTPTSAVQCQPAQFTISGANAPFFVSIIPGGQTGAAALENLPTVAAAGPVTWNVNRPAGTSVTIQVRDSQGTLNFSQAVTIQGSSDTSCLGASGTAPAAGSASSPASAASSNASGVAPSSASSLSSGVSSVVASGPSSRSSSSPSSSASSAAPARSSAPASGAGTITQSGVLAILAAAVMGAFA